MKELKAIELFAGIGGFRIDCDNLGIKTVWANDIEPKAVKVYKENFGDDAIIQGDINTLLDNIPEHDILTGGFPCQPFSKAGKKQGIADFRGTLFESIVNILTKKSPKYFVLENVNSILYLDKGRNYRTILAALSALNYKIEWRVFNAVNFGLPQHRERIIIVGSKDCETSDSYFLNQEEIENLPGRLREIIVTPTFWKDIEAPNSQFGDWGMAIDGKYVTSDIAEQLRNDVHLYDILENEVDDSYDFTEDTLHRIEDSVYVNKFYNGVQILYNQRGGARMGYSIFGTEGVSPTLTASTSRHYERYQIGNRFRRLTNVEYARLQGFPDQHCKAVKPYDQYKLFGNAVPHQIVQYALSRLVNSNKNPITSNVLNLFSYAQ